MGTVVPYPSSDGKIDPLVKVTRLIANSSTMIVEAGQIMSQVDCPPHMQVRIAGSIGNAIEQLLAAMGAIRAIAVDRSQEAALALLAAAAKEEQDGDGGDAA